MDFSSTRHRIWILPKLAIFARQALFRAIIRKKMEMKGGYPLLHAFWGFAKNLCQWGGFLCKGQGPGSVDGQLLQEVRKKETCSRVLISPCLGLARQVGGSSPAFGATSTGWTQPQGWGEGQGFSGEGSELVPPLSVSEEWPENSTIR